MLPVCHFRSECSAKSFFAGGSRLAAQAAVVRQQLVDDLDQLADTAVRYAVFPGVE